MTSSHWFICSKANHRYSHTALFTVFPLSGCRMDEAKQFISVDRFGIEVIPYRPPLQVYMGFMEDSQYLFKIENKFKLQHCTKRNQGFILTFLRF